MSGHSVYSGYPVIRDSQGKQTDPTTATVMADTGAIGSPEGFSSGGVAEVTAILSASAAAEFAIQVRNAANDATVGDAHVVYVAAGSSHFSHFRVQLNRTERVRVMMNVSLTGTAAANLMVQRVG